MKSLDANLITGKLMEPVSDDAVKIFSKADEYFQANIARSSPVRMKRLLKRRNRR